jgi:hypothetical protein
VPYTPGGILTMDRGSTPIWPNLANAGLDDHGAQRFTTTHHNWHLSTGEADDYGRPPRGAVLATHDCDDNGGRFFWAPSFQDAVNRIDGMPDYGDQDWDYR